jgi:hypothetical protein
VKRSSDTALSLRRSVARIAPYRPFGTGGEMQVEFARREFILAAAQENGGRFASLADCQDICKALWGLELEIDEIRAVVGRLVGAGKLMKDGPRYEVSPTAQNELGDRMRESSGTEAQAFSEWETSVKALDPDLTPGQVAELRDDLITWLHEIVSRHGIEAAVLLYPEHERTSQLTQEIEARGLGFLPERDSVVATVRAEALYAFIHRPTPAQRTHLAHLMTTAYLVAVFTIDPDAHEVVQSITKGQRIYLDTNVVYAILSLRGPRAHMSVRRVLELTRQLGYEICVTPWTVAEMKESVRRARKKLAQTTLPPRALAELAAETTGDETFVTAYWRKYKETGVKPDDFLDLHEQIESLLEKAGIAVVAEGCVGIDRNADGVNEQIGLLETVPGGVDKHRALQEHDVKHRLLVERLRGSGNRRFSNAGYLFLTNDSVLVPYAASKRVENAPPFTVSLTAWAHIVRSLCPRTEDYEQTIVDLLDTPSVRPRGVVSAETVAEVLGRIDMLTNDSTEEIATRVLLDSAIMKKVDASTGEARTRFIDDAVSEKKGELERQLRELQETAGSERAAREEAEREVAARADELELERAARHDAEERLAAAERKRGEREAEVEARIAEALRRSERDQQDREAENSLHRAAVQDLKTQVAGQVKLLRGLIAALILMVAVATVAVPVGIGWISDGWPLVLDLLAAGGLVLAGIAAAFGKKRATWVAVLVGTVLGAAAAVQQFVSADDPPSAPPAQR